MTIFRKLLNTAALTTAAGVGAWTFSTRNSKFVPILPTDPIFASPTYLKNNPNRNPATQDVCVRRVPLSKIKPQLLEKEGKLVEAFCAGVWGGLGYALQRRVMEKKYRSDPSTSHQLWDASDLLSSTYEPGTEITDHFQVVSKTPESIIVRCGDSPKVKGVRDSDGLFEMGVTIDREKGEAEFRLKSIFFKGLGKADSKPMPEYVEFAHRLYTKLWMETAIQNVMM